LDENLLLYQGQRESPLGAAFRLRICAASTDSKQNVKEKKLTVAHLLILLLLVSPLAAQKADLNHISPVALPDAPTPLQMTSTPATSAPPAAKRERVFDKKFAFVMGALGAAESLRFTTRRLVLEREFDAGAPWVTSVPSSQHVIAKDSAIYASEFLVAYELKKSHSWLPGDRVIRRLWWAYPAAMTAIHIKNAVGNIGTQGPGGCTSIECAEQMQ
jgi:hypothetical protein